MAYLLNTISGTIIPMCVTALVTLAITMIFKTSSTTNFAQGVVSAFGAFAVARAMTQWGLSVWMALPVGMFVAMAIAVAVDVVIFRNGRYVNAIGKQIITMGLMSIIVGVIPMIFGLDMPSIGGQLVSGSVAFNMDGQDVVLNYNTIVCMGISAVVIAAVFLLLRFSKWGLAVRSTASNEYVAGMMGINTRIITAISWGLAGALGALAAILNASNNATIEIYFMTNYQIDAFLAGILGGFATFYGPVVAAFFIPLCNNLLTWFGNVVGVPELSSWSRVIVYILALVIIFFKPQGLFGKRIEKKV